MYLLKSLSASSSLLPMMGRALLILLSDDRFATERRSDQ